MIRRKTMLKGMAIGAASSLVVACGGGGNGGGDDSAWPEEPVQFVIPTAAGGAADTVFREVQPYLEEELGQPLEVEYREGGQFTVGATHVAQNGGECEPFMMHFLPDLIFSYLTRDVPYTYDDFAPIGGFTVEPATMWVHDDAPWESMEELIEEAQDQPGEIRVGISSLTNANFIAITHLQDQTDAEFNVISYDGGGPARNALLAGEIEATMGGVYAGQSIAQESQALGVFQDENEWPELTNDAPTVNDALDLDLDPHAERYGFYATSECIDEYPERHQTLVDAVAGAVENEEYLALLEENGEEGKLIYEDPEEFDAYIQEEIDTVTQMVDENPELFGTQ